MHAQKKPMADDIDYMAVASMTEGMVGAELANIIEIAAINMMRDGRSEVCYVFQILGLNVQCSGPNISFSLQSFMEIDIGAQYFESATIPKFAVMVQNI